MSLHITLVNARPFYYPGDEISGHVTLDSKKSEDIAQVLIEFTGRCKVKIRRHDHYTTVSAPKANIANLPDTLKCHYVKSPRIRLLT